MKVEKKAYRRPQLVEYGRLAEVTQGIGGQSRITAVPNNSDCGGQPLEWELRHVQAPSPTRRSTLPPAALRRRRWGYTARPRPPTARTAPPASAATHRIGSPLAPPWRNRLPGLTTMTTTLASLPRSAAPVARCPAADGPGGCPPAPGGGHPADRAAPHRRRDPGPAAGGVAPGGRPLRRGLAAPHRGQHRRRHAEHVRRRAGAAGTAPAPAGPLRRARRPLLTQGPHRPDDGPVHQRRPRHRGLPNYPDLDRWWGVWWGSPSPP